MPKRPRQAHLPAQVTKRRKVRRPFEANRPIEAPETASAAESMFDSPLSEPVDAVSNSGSASRPRRRLQVAQAAREGNLRISPGQLPMFEHGFIERELRQIAITSTILLGVIVLLTIVLR